MYDLVWKIGETNLSIRRRLFGLSIMEVADFPNFLSRWYVMHESQNNHIYYLKHIKLYVLSIMEMAEFPNFDPADTSFIKVKQSSLLFMHQTFYR